MASTPNRRPEKALKAVAVALSIEIRRTHDLVALAKSIEDRGEVLPLSLDQLRELNPFAVEYRYDDEIIPDMTRQTLDMMLGQVFRWAETQVNRCL